MESFIKLLGALALIPFMIIYHALSWGFVAYKAYYWFVYPQINVPDFSYIQWAGFIFFLAVIMPTHYEYVKKEYVLSSGEKFAMGLIHPWMYLFMAWILSFIC